MSGNRVEKLEDKVRELEATINGLTDELVETKERLGAIEDEAGIEPDVLEGRLTRRTESDAETSTRESDAETSKHESDAENGGEENGDAASDDIIVA